MYCHSRSRCANQMWRPSGAAAGPGDAARLRLPDELHAGAAVDVPHPQLRVAQVAARERPRADRGDDVVAVRQPVRRLVVVDRGVGHLPRRLRLDVDPPDVLGAVPVRHEHHLRAVGAVARLRVVGHPLGERGRVAAGERDRVEVAQQVEDDGPAVRADVDGDPGPLVGVQRQGAFRLEREVRRVRPATLLGGRSPGGDGHEHSCGHERGRMHRSPPCRNTSTRPEPMAWRGHEQPGQGVPQASLRPSARWAGGEGLPETEQYNVARLMRSGSSRSTELVSDSVTRMPIPFEFVMGEPPVSQQARRRERVREWTRRVRNAATGKWRAELPGNRGGSGDHNLPLRTARRSTSTTWRSRFWML